MCSLELSTEGRVSKIIRNALYLSVQYNKASAASVHDAESIRARPLPDIVAALSAGTGARPYI